MKEGKQYIYMDGKGTISTTFVPNSEEFDLTPMEQWQKTRAWLMSLHLKNNNSEERRIQVIKLDRAFGETEVVHFPVKQKRNYGGLFCFLMGVSTGISIIGLIALFYHP